MDMNFIQTHYKLYVEAGILTIKIAAIGILLSLIIGIICSLIKTMKIPVLKTIVSIYIELSRNTPLLIQLFWIAKDRNCLKFRNLWNCRTSLFGGKLYGRSI